jgi:hypothetical protein|tara:strand:+ start:139 stop:381 length:243 start_codon:yes stop_codon:yes gene_type:complete
MLWITGFFLEISVLDGFLIEFLIVHCRREMYRTSDLVAECHQHNYTQSICGEDNVHNRQYRSYHRSLFECVQSLHAQELG